MIFTPMGLLKLSLEGSHASFENTIARLNQGWHFAQIFITFL